MSFPLPEPDQNAKDALAKAWRRQDLALYLRRWENAPQPAPPPEFLHYSWRACDVGSGFGKYLLKAAERFPDRGFLGLDKGSLRGGAMVRRFREKELANLFGLHCNAIPFLAALADQCLDQLTLFYPNPWWPPKHRKKRWAYHPLLPKLVRLLKPGGEILLTSNEAFYLSEWIYALNHHPAIENLDLVYAGPIRVVEGRTHFETKFLKEGVPCGEVVFKKPMGHSESFTSS